MHTCTINGRWLVVFRIAIDLDTLNKARDALSSVPLIRHAREAPGKHSARITVYLQFHVIELINYPRRLPNSLQIENLQLLKFPDTLHWNTAWFSCTLNVPSILFYECLNNIQRIV